MLIKLFENWLDCLVTNSMAIEFQLIAGQMTDNVNC